MSDFWLSVLSLLVAICSAIFARRSNQNAARALAIAESQEDRRRPLLRVYLSKGYRRSFPERQVFAFLVTVSNPTDIDNSLARAELQLSYLLENDISATVRVSHNADLANVVGDTASTPANVFSSPIRIDAHQTAVGWFVFGVDRDIIRGRTIDAHRLILEDTHGTTSETGSILVGDWADEDRTE